MNEPMNEESSTTVQPVACRPSPSTLDNGTAVVDGQSSDLTWGWRVVSHGTGNGQMAGRSFIRSVYVRVPRWGSAA